MSDPLRLVLGTLTALPVRPPRYVDRGVAGWAMALAPLVGALLSVVTLAFMWVLQTASVSPLLEAAMTIGLLALLTRALHLDGLADLADGLGSGRSSSAALAIMRRSDIGPFGVVTLTLALLVQAAALSHHIAEGRGGLAATLALVVSRSVLPLICSKGIPAARPDGLGLLVAGSVGRGQLLLGAVLTCVAMLVAALVTGTGSVRLDLRAAVVAALTVPAGAAFCWWCVRRLGGVTGDVMGACVEITFTVALVVLTLV